MLELLQAPAVGASTFELGPFGSALGGTVVGALLSLAVFRGRLDVYAAKFEALEKKLSEQRAEDQKNAERTLHDMQQRFDMQCSGIAQSTEGLRSDFLAWTREARNSLTTGYKESSRREEYLLELVLGIAHKQGVKHRFSDVLAQLQSQSDKDDQPKER